MTTFYESPKKQEYIVLVGGYNHGRKLPMQVYSLMPQILVPCFGCKRSEIEVYDRQKFSFDQREVVYYTLGGMTRYEALEMLIEALVEGHISHIRQTIPIQPGTKTFVYVGGSSHGEKFLVPEGEQLPLRVHATELYILNSINCDGQFIHIYIPRGLRLDAIQRLLDACVEQAEAYRDETIHHSEIAP